MIGLAPPVVYEVQNHTATDVAVCAVIEAPNLDASELFAWHALGSAMMDGTAHFTAEDLFRFGGQAGKPPRVWTTADWMIVSVTAPASGGGLEVATDVVASLVTEPELRDETLSKWIATGRDPKSAWECALMPQSLDERGVTPRTLRDLYRRALDPARIRWSVAGKFEVGTGRAAVEARLAEWIKTSRPQPNPVRASRWDTRAESPVTSFELRSSAALATPVAFATNLLAVVGLGVGKSSAMHQVLREKLSLSYQQQAILWPTRVGWQSRLFVFTQATAEDAGRPETIRSALASSISQWTEGDVARMNAIARACLDGDFIMNPLWLIPTTPYQGSSSDQAILAALSRGVLSREAVEKTLPAIRLDLVQAEARRILDGQWFTIRGALPKN